MDSFLALAWALVNLTLSSLHLCTILNLDTKNELMNVFTYLLATQIPWAISPQYVLLFMRRSSQSFSLEINSFLKPFGSMCLVLWSCLLPIFISFWLPLILLLMKQSIPLTFLWESGYKTNTSLKMLGTSTYVDSLPLMRLESSWDSGDFLHDFLAFQRLDSHYFIFNKEYIRHSQPLL